MLGYRPYCNRELVYFFFPARPPLDFDGNTSIIRKIFDPVLFTHFMWELETGEIEDSNVVCVMPDCDSSLLKRSKVFLEFELVFF